MLPYFKQWMAVNSNDALNLFSAFTGGSFENFSMFALGITPLITAQIVVQLLGSVIPSLGKLQKRGEHGQKVTKRITNIVGIVLAIVQSCCMAIGFNKGGLINGNGVACVILITTFMTAGTGIMMWLAHILDEKSIGNGVSILLMANILSRMPGQFASLFKSLAKDKSTPIAALFNYSSYTNFCSYHYCNHLYDRRISPAACTVFTEDESVWRRRRNRSYPVKVGISGVMPVIFASSLMAIPQLIAAIAGKGYGSGLSKVVLNMMSQKNWFDNDNPVYGLGLLIYLALIVFFAYFYLPITFNAAEVSDNIRRSGGFVPGIRAGEDTEQYIQYISRRLTSIGVVMLICVTVIPIIICGALGLNSTIGGTSLIIVIGVITETVQQIQLELAGRNYCGILCRD